MLIYQVCHQTGLLRKNQGNLPQVPVSRSLLVIPSIPLLLAKQWSLAQLLRRFMNNLLFPAAAKLGGWFTNNITTDMANSDKIKWWLELLRAIIAAILGALGGGAAHMF